MADRIEAPNAEESAWLAILDATTEIDDAVECDDLDRIERWTNEIQASVSRLRGEA